VVDHLTYNPKIMGSYTTTGTGREIEAKILFWPGFNPGSTVVDHLTPKILRSPAPILPLALKERKGENKILSVGIRLIKVLNGAGCKKE
jgi:hypothetical protein